MVRKIGMVLVGMFLLSTVGCNNTPTVPLPPPEVVSSTSPDGDGFVTVVGGVDDADPESIVLLYNEETESGVMEAAEENGTFEVRVAAEPGDTLVLQYKIANALSYEETIIVK